jgi:tRNA nucleotidyltransferase (CCA-adding enzyme)
LKNKDEALSKWKKIKKEIVKELRPTTEEETQLLSFADNILTKLNNVLLNAGINAKAELHGSVAHGTWISGQQDIDVFIVIEEFKKNDQLFTTLKTIKKGVDWSFTEAYAQHPYLKTEINGYNLDVVPCFRIKEGEDIHSATDRTPLHTNWLYGKIEDLQDEVRLLKQFLMTLGIYGAEIKIGGLSGYLCELLVIYYGSFWELLDEASEWGIKKVISFNGEDVEDFNDPLIVIDPVDSSRNVASALKKDSYFLFIAASQNFRAKPSKIFFEEKAVEVQREVIIDILKKRPTDILFIVVEESVADVADVLWGQLHKSRQALEQQFNENDFKVLRSTTWSNEETRHIFIYELESAKIPEAMKHMGPPAHLEKNVEEFIKAYEANPRTIAGPDLIGDRWFVLINRDYTDIKSFTSKLLYDGGRSIGISRKISVRILQHHRILLNEEIEEYLVDGFDAFLYDWLEGRPLWVE